MTKEKNKAAAEMTTVFLHFIEQKCDNLLYFLQISNYIEQKIQQ